MSWHWRDNAWWCQLSQHLRHYWLHIRSVHHHHHWSILDAGHDPLCPDLVYRRSFSLCSRTCLVLHQMFVHWAGRPKKFKIFKAFSFNNSRPIQGLLPVDHSTAYIPTGTWEKNTLIWSIRAWRLLIISCLRSSSISLIATVAGSSHSHKVLLKVSHRQIPNFPRPSTRFPKQFKDIFSFMKFKDFSRLALNSRPAQKPWTLSLLQVMYTFQCFTSRTAKLFLLISSLDGCALSFNECPLVIVLFDNSYHQPYSDTTSA